MGPAAGRSFPVHRVLVVLLARVLAARVLAARVLAEPAVSCAAASCATPTRRAAAPPHVAAASPNPGVKAARYYVGGVGVGRARAEQAAAQLGRTARHFWRTFKPLSRPLKAAIPLLRNQNPSAPARLKAS